MDKHTYLNKRKIGSTDICDFTDYQGIGRDPLYKRYDSVNSIVRRVIDPQYAHFLAVPYYSTDSDTINWYIDEWNETPERYVELEVGQKERYAALKKVTVAHYKASLDKLSGEDLQVMVSVLRYINDEFIYCCDGKVYLLAWGMTPDPRKHVSPGELVHESSNTLKHKITFDPGAHGRLASKIDRVLTVSEERIIQAKDLPFIEADPNYVHVGWDPNPVGMKLTSDLTVTAIYETRSEKSNAIVPDPEPAPVPKPEPEPEPQLATVTFDAGEYGMLQGSGIIRKTIGSKLYANDIPGIMPLKGYRFSGWSINPMNLFVNGDTTIRAVYEKKHTWYRRWWLWLTGSGCLKWLLWILVGTGCILLSGGGVLVSRKISSEKESDQKANADIIRYEEMIQHARSIRNNQDSLLQACLYLREAEKLEDLYAGTEFASRFDADAGSSIVLMEKQIDSLFSKWKSLAMDSYEAYREWGDAYEKGFALEYIRNALSLKDDNELKKIKSLLEK